MDLTRQRWIPFFNTITQEATFSTSFLDAEPDYIFKIADTTNDLLQAFHLLYHEYLNAGYVQEKPDKILFTKHHLLPKTTVFVAKSKENVLSTASLFRDTEVFGLPMDTLYKKELESLRVQHRKILEIGSLASDRHGFSRCGTTNFTRLLLLYCVFSNIDDVCIMVNPKHVHLYKNRCGFEIFGEQKFYSTVNAYAVPLRADVRTVRKKLSGLYSGFPLKTELYAKYFSLKIKISNNILKIFEDGVPSDNDLNPLNSDFYNIFLFGRNEDLCNLSSECRSFLKNIYPGMLI